MGNKHPQFSTLKEVLLSQFTSFFLIDLNGKPHKRWKISIYKENLEIDDQEGRFTPERPYFFFNQLSTLIDEEGCYSCSGTTSIKFTVILTLQVLQEGELDFEAFCKGHIIILDGLDDEIERTEFLVLKNH
jgi:hypothetical protein